MTSVLTACQSNQYTHTKKMLAKLLYDWVNDKQCCIKGLFLKSKSGGMLIKDTKTTVLLHSE